MLDAFAAFGDRLLVLSHRELSERRAEALSRVWRHLGLDPEALEVAELEKVQPEDVMEYLIMDVGAPRSPRGSQGFSRSFRGGVQVDAWLQGL